MRSGGGGAPAPGPGAACSGSSLGKRDNAFPATAKARIWTGR
jgi:hypothetical protein